jgi:hypothetical protein
MPLTVALFYSADSEERTRGSPCPDPGSGKGERGLGPILFWSNPLSQASEMQLARAQLPPQISAQLPARLREELVARWLRSCISPQ